jgi:hypothetical protein
MIERYLTTLMIRGYYHRVEAKQECLTYGFYLIALTAGLFITIFVFAIVSSLFF